MQAKHAVTRIASSYYNSCERVLNYDHQERLRDASLQQLGPLNRFSCHSKKCFSDAEPAVVVFT